MFSIDVTPDFQLKTDIHFNESHGLMFNDSQMSRERVALPVMNQPLRRGVSMEHTGYLGNSRLVLNHFDAATQADIQHIALSYESEDEMGRLHARSRRGTALYSKQDIREQYCISDRGLGALETDRRSFFGCLSTHQNSPCSNRTSLLTVCVRQKIPSDENLQDLYRKYPHEYAPYPRRSPRYPWGPPPPEIYRFDEDLNSSYFRKKVPQVDPSRYTWMPSDDESVRMERPRPILDTCPAHPALPPPPPPAQRPKHVSFARSHTLTSFDDAVVSLNSSSSHLSRMSRSQERLLDVRKIANPIPITRQPEPSDSIITLDKLKRTPTSMKTQATQTEACLGRKPIPPSQLNLSPRTIHRVKMVSQGAQTNGILINGRKLMKSYSEAGRFAMPQTFPQETTFPAELTADHEPLQRTQSEEPPRSPFIVTTPPPQELAPPQSDTSSLTHESEDSETKGQREIFIDFKPQMNYVPGQQKKPLMKTQSDGEILMDQRKSIRGEDGIVPEKPFTSISHENIMANDDDEPRNFAPYFKNTPIRHEGIFKNFDDHVFSSISESFEDRGFLPQDSLDEEFHEHMIYDGRYLTQDGSTTSEPETLDEGKSRKSDGASPEDEGIVPSSCLLPDRRLSPFASSDSLANDLRDHSDGIWNESQATVLQADSGTENGTGISSSEMTSLVATSPGGVTLLTPSSRRKHLLMLQHQQRSSMDTEALDEEPGDQGQIPSPSSPRVSIEKPSISIQGPDSSVSNSSKQQYLTPRRTTSPAWRKRTPEPPSESPLPAVVPELLLARTDSGKTNTDVSESTTTTDDYITATSGTDSSRKSSSNKGNDKHRSPQTNAQEGSSFESASSMYSVARSEYFGDDMVVPSFSPPPIPEEAGSDAAASPVPPEVAGGIAPLHVVIHTPSRAPGRSSPSGSSSSSGSYSIDGSCPDLPQRPKVPSPKKHVPSVSEDEHSIHYSSSGYYESPLEDDVTWKSSKSDRKDWNEDEKKRKKRPYTLDITKQPPTEEQVSPTTDKKKTLYKKAVSPSKELLKAGDKPKRGKTRTRSPMQNHRKSQPTKKSPPSLVRSPAVSDQMLDDDLTLKAEEAAAASSEESSSGVCGEPCLGQTSPRKSKKMNNVRRKSTPKSPTGMRMRRRSGSNEDKPSSLPGTLARRRSSAHTRSGDEDSLTLHSSKSRLSPRSPSGSPNKRRRSPKTSPDSARLKALSAESLRSVSPGSDSVFYSDPSSHAAPSEHQVHCLHCGKEVDIVTTDDPERSLSSNGQQADIVQPPAGFADSPRQKHSTGRLYKKLEKRFRSEERSQGERRHHRYRPDVRAKSEERGGKAETCRVKLRPMARSTDASLEGLRATDSSPSVLPGAPEDEDDLGLYNVPYLEGCWIYIDDHEELQTWHRQESGGDDEIAARRDSASSAGSTESEHEFRKRYQAVTHRMVHRKSCLEMYKRQASKSFESDKTVIVRRGSGEFGFRIHGSKPVVVSAIEPDTPAESSGLEVGDIVLAVNGVSVLDKSHSEVVKIAHAGSDTLTLEVARTCGVLSPTTAEVYGGTPLYSGYLWKLGGHASGTPINKWVRRWFSLKKDNCLYFYKTDMDKQPVGAMMLLNYEISRVDDSDGSAPPRQFRFCLRKPGVPTLHLAADTEAAVARWLEVLIHAAEESQMADTWLEQTRRNLTLAPNQIQRPDCFGYLVKLGTQWKSWSRRYCVLKDACLYFYQEATSKSAFGVACLHGYRVQQSTTGSKKHAFEIIPSDPGQKHYYFHTESDMDRKRWLAALEYSIDRWLKVG